MYVPSAEKQSRAIGIVRGNNSEKSKGLGGKLDFSSFTISTANDHLAIVFLWSFDSKSFRTCMEPVEFS